MVGPRGIPGIPGERGEQVTLYTYLSSAFSLHTVITKCVSLCVCIRERLALMDLKETEANQAWRSEQIDICVLWFIVMSSCVFYSAIQVSQWMLKISNNDTRTTCLFTFKGGWDSDLCSKWDEPALWWVDDHLFSSGTIFHNHQWLFHILKSWNQSPLQQLFFLYWKK